MFGLPCARARAKNSGSPCSESKHQAGPALMPRRSLLCGVSGEGSRACLEPYCGQAARETWSQDRTKVPGSPGVTEPWDVPRGAPASPSPTVGRPGLERDGVCQEQGDGNGCSNLPTLRQLRGRGLQGRSL